MSACASAPRRPCQDGGELARDYGTRVFRGTRQCMQEKDKFGRWYNQGPYREWYEGGQVAVEGEYKMGHKIGRWVEYDEKGRKLSDKIIEAPKEEKLRQ